MQFKVRSQVSGHAAWPEEVLERAAYRQEWFSRRQSEDPVRVFVVDSDVGRSARLTAQVHAIGAFETRIAFSADSALRVAGEFVPNIVLLSTDLPELASYRLATALRWNSSLLGVRLIALTSDIPAADRRRALEAGFEQYLILPVQHSTLESVLRPSRQRGSYWQRPNSNRRRH